MMNLALKLTILSGFLMMLAFRGDVEQRWVSASEPATRPAVDTLQAKAGDPTVSAPAPALATPSPSDTAVPRVIPETSHDHAATSFASEVLRLSTEADGVDLVWQTYREKCGVQVGRQYDFGREWFAIWDRAAEATIDGPGCGDWLARVRQAGDKLGRGILRARTLARQAGLDRGTEIGMLRWHGLQWSQFEEDRPRPRSSAPPVVGSTASTEAPHSGSSVGRQP